MNDNWFYLDSKRPAESQRVGPISRQEIERLASTGAIQKDDLVWYPGLVNWLAWKEVAPDFPGNSDSHRCASCQQEFAEKKLSLIDGRWTCTSCKKDAPAQATQTPNVLEAPHQETQTLVADTEAEPLQAAQGLSAPAVANDIFAPFGIRLAAVLVDLMILGVANAILILIYMFVFHVPQKVIEDSLAINIPGLFLEACYQVYFLSQFGGTPGKMLMGLRVIAADGSRLTVTHALGRYLAFWVSAFTLGIGFLIVIFDPERRALHDHIAKTRVQFFRAQI